MRFPDSFTKEPHHLVPGGFSWTAVKANGHTISVVGGGMMHLLRGDGVTTFEVLDDDWIAPRCYQTVDQINQYLAEISD